MFFRRRRLREQDLERELRDHLEFEAAELSAEGIDSDEARWAARRRLGNLTRIKEDAMAMWGAGSFETLFQDVKYAVRGLGRSPGFVALATAALAVGIGANTAIFSIIDHVMFRPLGYREPDRLVAIYEGLPKAGIDAITFSAPDFEGYRARQRSFSAMAAYENKPFEVSGTEEPQRVVGARATASLFNVLGVSPSLGRTFSDEEERSGRPFVVLSDVFWRSTLHGDPSVIGRAIHLDRKPYTVIGVMPPAFEFPSRGTGFNKEPAAFFVPMNFTSDELLGFASRFNKSAIARLAPGVSTAQASAEAAAMANRIAKEVYPAGFGIELSATVVPYRDEVIGRVRTTLAVLLGAVALILLIACADVANLLLTKAATRQREIAVRMALGASRARLVRYGLIESFVLASAGAFAGAVIARPIVQALVRAAPVNLPRVETIHIDARVLLFTMAVAVATALLFGLAPAIEATRPNVGDTLKENGRSGTTTRRRGRILGALVAAQFAIAMVLLTGAGLLLHSFSNLMSVNPGFRPERVLTLSTSLPANTYRTAADVRGFYNRFLERVRSLPGVKAAGASPDLPLNIRERRALTAEGSTQAAGSTVANVWPVGEYFQALGIPLRSGRFLTWQDDQNSEPVVVVNETLARKFYAGQQAVGHRVKWGSAQSKAPWMRIVGVVADVKQAGLGTEVVPQTYQPYSQVADSSIADSLLGIFRSLTLAIRTDGDPLALTGAVREEVRRMDPVLPVSNVKTMEDVLDEAVRPQRFNSYLLGAFAAIALILAAVGVGGVMAYSVSQRTQEIGIRIALGARRTNVVGMVLRRGMLLAGVGITAGLLVSIAGMRVVSTLLFGVGPRDPWTLVIVTLVLAGTALIAILVPAYRASRVDPIVAIRYE